MHTLPMGDDDRTSLEPKLALADTLPQFADLDETRQRSDRHDVPEHWTVHRYALFCAHRAVNPASEPALRLRNGLHDDDALRALELRWSQRFERDPALQASFHGLVERWKRTLRV